MHKNLTKNYFYGIYDRDTYYVLMKKLKSVYEDFHNNNSGNDLYLGIKNSTLHKKITNLISEIGCSSLIDIIDYNYDDWYKNNIDSYNDFSNLRFFNDHFNCLSYKTYNSTSKEYSELIKSEKILFVRNDSSIRYKRSLLERLNCAEICIHIKNDFFDEFLCVYGYFNLCNNVTINYQFSLSSKLLSLTELINIDPKTSKFKNNYLSIMSLKTIIIEPIDKIMDEINHAYNEFIVIKNKPNSMKVKDFLLGSIIIQRDILNYLLCSESEEDILFANLLFDSISKNTELTKINPNSDELFKSLHFNVQEKLKDAFKTYENIKKKIMDDSDSDLPYDKRIIMMNSSDSIKKKAFMKLKEMEGSRESSTKAQSYLDGLLKIPFGIYKKEPIFTNRDKFISDLESKIKSIKDLNKKFKNDKNKYVNGLFILLNNLLDKFALCNTKFDSEIENFLRDAHDSSCAIHKLLISEASDKDYEDPNSKSLVPANFFSSNNDFRGIYLNVCDILDKLVQSWDTFVKSKTSYLDEVDRILDDAVYGHKHTKKELKRLIGQWINGKIEGNVIGLCGPPGVGKTSFAKRGLSKCLKDDKGIARPFAFLPIGGATNGSFLEGHGYTYLGSTWGKIADILMEAGCMNPIIFVDELDKVSNTEHGREIIGILTHITDPAQNNEYHDKFFQGIPIDLSKALFVFSYNDRGLIDRILRDRIHEINIKALTKEEKIHITKYYTFPELYANIGFSDKDIVWEDSVIEDLIDNYTYEAGIRKLNELLNEILRDINLERIKNPNILPKLIDKKFVEEVFREKPKSRPQTIHSEPKVGLINGLYASASGLGGLTPIEVVKSFSDSKLSLELTGSQGDVMKESMKVAKTLTWNLIPDIVKQKLKEDMELNGNFGLHIHCPDGATPKDGPSAGGAITVAIVSRLCNVRVRNDLCMTGEINLQGKFTAIGGLDAKLKGGEKAGCKIAIIPKENEDDYKNIIKDYNLSLDVKIVDNIHDVLKYALIEEDLIKYKIEFNKF